MAIPPPDSVLAQMLRENGQTPEDFARQQAKAEATGSPFRSKHGVQRSAELNRILALPRRRWEDRADVLAAKITDFLRAPGGSMKLRPIQGAALADIHDYRGGLIAARVGAGKTIISLLAFVVLASRRPVLLLPAKLIDKTTRDQDTLRKHWLLPGHVKKVSYEILGRPQHALDLEDIKPDVIVADECHKLKNPQAAVTKRMKRYMKAHPETIFVGMSGTILKRSLNDFMHIAEWALKGLNPTPATFQDRIAWAMALDEVKDDEGRLAPGALIELCNDEERARYAEEPLRTVRVAFQRRLTDTPGVVASQDGQLSMSLRIDSVSPEVNGIDDALAKLRNDWERPDGEPIVEAIEMWRHVREIALGFYYRWNPMPPPEWLMPRRTWAKMCREILKHNRSGLDSPSQVVDAIDAGFYPVAKSSLDGWRAVQNTFVPKTEAVWLTQDVLKFCADWMQREKGICWVEHVEFGNCLSLISGVSFYQRGGVNQAGSPIEMHPEGTPMIASIASNGEGRNLQGWNKSLVTSPPSSGAIWEQLLGREHRDGQLADEVIYTVMVNVPEQAAAFERACRDAGAQTDLTGQEQRLSYADITVVKSEDVRR